MPDPITDPPSPEETAETERRAGELLAKPLGLDHIKKAVADLKTGGSLEYRDNLACWLGERAHLLAAEIAALRSLVADLSLALAREAQGREKAERERDALLDVWVSDLGPDAPENARFLATWPGHSSREARWSTHAAARAARAAVRKAAGLDAEGGDP